MKRDEIESLVGFPRTPDAAETAARVYADSALWPSFESALYPDAAPTDGERAVIRRVVAERCGGAEARRQAWLRDFTALRLARIAGDTSGFALAASSGAAAASEAASPAEDPVTFVFVSESSGGRGGTWRAELTLPPDAAVDAMLPIEVTDGAGEPVPAGIFSVAGVALPVVQGRADIPYGMFLSGLKDANVEFTDADGVRSHGTLALF